jgi:hypothetical protein
LREQVVVVQHRTVLVVLAHQAVTVVLVQQTRALVVTVAAMAVISRAVLEGRVWSSSATPTRVTTSPLSVLV